MFLDLHRAGLLLADVGFEIFALLPALVSLLRGHAFVSLPAPAKAGCPAMAGKARAAFAGLRAPPDRRAASALPGHAASLPRAMAPLSIHGRQYSITSLWIVANRSSRAIHSGATRKPCITVV